MYRSPLQFLAKPKKTDLVLAKTLFESKFFLKSLQQRPCLKLEKLFVTKNN